MTARERRRTAQKHAFCYQAYREEVLTYRADALSSLRSPRTDSIPGSTGAGTHSDPTEKAGIRLADMPEHLKTKWKWVKAIEDTWKECKEEDWGEPFGLAYLFEKNFRLTGEVTGKELNAAVREKIIADSDICVKTFYNRLEAITDMLVYHAAKRGLI